MTQEVIVKLDQICTCLQKKKKGPEGIADKFGWGLQRIPMVGSKMSLSMVGWERLLRSSIRMRGSPSLKATVELWFARRMGEKQYMEEKVGRIKGEKKNPAYFSVCLRPALISHLLHSHRADKGTQTSSIPHTPSSHAAPTPSMP